MFAREKVKGWVPTPNVPKVDRPCIKWHTTSLQVSKEGLSYQVVVQRHGANQVSSEPSGMYIVDISRRTLGGVRRCNARLKIFALCSNHRKSISLWPVIWLFEPLWWIVRMGDMGKFGGLYARSDSPGNNFGSMTTRNATPRGKNMSGARLPWQCTIHA